MVEFVACTLIVSGFWMLLELGKFLLCSLREEQPSAELAALPGREYVERYAEAFRRLAESYQQLPKKKEYFGEEELCGILEQMKERVCCRCSRYEGCWNENRRETCRIILRCLEGVERGAGLYSDELLEFQNYCSEREEFLLLLREEFLRERTSFMWNNRMLEQRTAVGEQIRDTAGLLEQMSERLYQIRGLKERDMHRLRKELGYEKVKCKNAWIFSRDEVHPEFYLTLRVEDVSCIQAKDLSEILTEVLGTSLVPAGDCRLAVKREYDTFHYITDTRFQMFCGIAHMTKEGELVSGDNFAFWQGDCGQLIMSLADGMGTGVRANRESENVIELLEKFLNAGFSQETALRMINSSMLLADSGRVFSTVDLCMVDLYNGKCRILKAGACPTYIRRQNTIETISCRSLPAGVLQQSEFASEERRLFSGDALIMMTDGAADALPEMQREEILKEILLKCYTSNAREYAASIMEQILLRQEFRVRDDMTVLVGEIWNKANDR